MKKTMRFFRRTRSPKRTQSDPTVRRRATRSLCIEPLEDRSLLSLLTLDATFAPDSSYFYHVWDPFRPYGRVISVQADVTIEFEGYREGQTRDAMLTAEANGGFLLWSNIGEFPANEPTTVRLGISVPASAPWEQTLESYFPLAYVLGRFGDEQTFTVTNAQFEFLKDDAVDFWLRSFKPGDEPRHFEAEVSLSGANHEPNRPYARFYWASGPNEEDRLETFGFANANWDDGNGTSTLTIGPPQTSEDVPREATHIHAITGVPPFVREINPDNNFKAVDITDIEITAPSFGDTSQTVDFSYRVSGNPGDFNVGLYLSENTDFDGPNTDREVATILVSPEPNSDGTARFSFNYDAEPLLGDPALKNLLIVADPEGNIDETHDENSTRTNNNVLSLFLPAVELDAKKSMELVKRAEIEIGLNEDSGDPTYGFEIRWQDGQGPDGANYDWHRMEESSADTLRFTPRLAGSFLTRAAVDINGVTYYSQAQTVAVTFPAWWEIKEDGLVQGLMEGAWATTVGYVEAHKGTRAPPENWLPYPDAMEREYGFVIYLDTRNGRTEYLEPEWFQAGGEVYVSDIVEWGARVSVNLVPSNDEYFHVDSSANPFDDLANAYAVYPVATFHTHTPFTYYPSGYWGFSGPSGQDRENSLRQDMMPGFVYDYPSTYKDAGHDINSVRLYVAKPLRRPLKSVAGRRNLAAEAAVQPQLTGTALPTGVVAETAVPQGPKPVPDSFPASEHEAQRWLYLLAEDSLNHRNRVSRSVNPGNLATDFLMMMMWW